MRIETWISPDHQAARDRIRDYFAAEGVVDRIRARDASVWYPAAATQARIRQRLGWLDLPDQIGRAIGVAQAWIDQAVADGIADVLFVATNGANHLARCWQALSASPRFRLRVLDSIEPTTVRATLHAVDWTRAAVVICADHDPSPEWEALARLVIGRVEQEHGDLRRLALLAPPAFDLPIVGSDQIERLPLPQNVSERFGALSLSGVLPALLMGVDADQLAQSIGSTDQTDAAATELGALLSALAQRGRDKLTVVADRSVQPLAQWIGSLTAASLAKHGRGFVPMVDEPRAPPTRYRHDRIFVVLDLQRSDPTIAAHVQALRVLQHPIIHMRLNDRYELAQFFRCWQLAVALAAVVIGLNPFDEPDTAAQNVYVRSLLLSGAVSGRSDQTATTLAAALPLLRRAPWVALMIDGATDAAMLAQVDRLRRLLLDRLGCPTLVIDAARDGTAAIQMLHAGRQDGAIMVLRAPGAIDLTLPGTSWSVARLQQARRQARRWAWRQQRRSVAQIDLGRQPAQQLAAQIDQIELLLR